tara:strand:+ start:750 stop:1004 length:255 start_codon:yes stop_codon:yes gene_type:complete
LDDPPALLHTSGCSEVFSFGSAGYVLGLGKLSTMEALSAPNRDAYAQPCTSLWEDDNDPMGWIAASFYRCNRRANPDLQKSPLA